MLRSKERSTGGRSACAKRSRATGGQEGIGMMEVEGRPSMGYVMHLTLEEFIF